MNRPSAATPSCQCRPVRTHQRRNNAIAPAYDLVVNSEPSRPNRTCRKNASASATIARSSSSTVQYLTPDGNLTGNARTLISSRSRHQYDYQPRAPQPGRSVAAPARVAGLRNVTQQFSQPQKRSASVVDALDPVTDRDFGGGLGWPCVAVVELD